MDEKAATVMDLLKQDGEFKDFMQKKIRELADSASLAPLKGLSASSANPLPKAH